MRSKAIATTSINQPAKRWWTVVLVILTLLLVLIFIAAARRNRPVEETVTLSQSIRPKITTGTPVANASPLTVGDRDLELIGDRVAEATVLLRDRQRGPALRAIAAAENLTRQMRETRPDIDRQLLNGTATELAIIDRDIQRGELEPTLMRLVQLSRRLDSAVAAQQ
ncbi:MAG: hypothetical protein ABIP75_07720 [Pyrinomonadaceae bacterium]